MPSNQKVGWIGRWMGPGYGKGSLRLESDRRCRLRYGLVVGEVHRDLSAVWSRWVFRTILVQGETAPQILLSSVQGWLPVPSEFLGGCLCRDAPRVLS